MPMMVSDGFLDTAFFAYLVSRVPGNQDFALQNAVSTAVSAAAITGATSCTVTISAYPTALVQLMIERLTNMGYTATTTSTTLTVNFSSF